MPYNLGVVGIGHWFFRLHEGIMKTNEIQLLNIASASTAEKHKAHLEKLNVPESRYFQVVPGQPIPEEFFNDIDIVHIANPNEFHSSQTLQSLKKNKIVITEKTLGVNKEEFENITNYIIANNLQNKAYLHLHYAHKLITLQLPELLKRLTKEYGKITHTSATFFEKESKDLGRRRLWLFDLKNGGLFMDWIHPFETYYKGALAEKMDLKNVSIYALNSEYSTTNPTGIYARVGLEGIFFANEVEAQIRIAIGIKDREETKSMRFIFEGGQCLDLSFVNSEIEYTTDNRGSWALHEKPGGTLIEAASPKGPTASDVLVNDILELCRGRNPGFTMNDLSIIYAPQWKYQEMLKSVKLIADPEEVAQFVNDGLNIPPNQKLLA